MSRVLRAGSIAVLVVAAAACTPTTRVSVGNNGSQANSHSFGSSLSYDGRYVAFESSATNLVAGDTNNAGDAFVRDNLNKTTERVSVTSNGAQADRGGLVPQLDDSGRYVAFLSDSTNLGVSCHGCYEAYVHDRQTGVTQPLMAVDCCDLDISGSGRYVAVTYAGSFSVYDRTLGAVTGGDVGAHASLSDDGHFAAFTRPRPSGSDGAQDVFVRDLVAHTTTAVPLAPASTDANPSGSDAHISGDGRYVAYTERVFLDAPNPPDIVYRYFAYVFDRQTSKLSRVDIGSDGTPAVGSDSTVQAISDNGRDVMFRSADKLVPGIPPSGDNVFVRDQVGQKTYLVDRNAGEAVANDYSAYGSDISGDATQVAFTSQATNIAPNDTNGAIDVFVRAFPGAPPPS